MQNHALFVEALTSITIQQYKPAWLETAPANKHTDTSYARNLSPYLHIYHRLLITSHYTHSRHSARNELVVPEQ